MKAGTGRQETTKGKSERRGEEERENRGTVNIQTMGEHRFRRYFGLLHSLAFPLVPWNS